MPNFSAISILLCCIIEAVSIDCGHNVVQVVHKKQDSNIFFRFLSNSRLPLLYTPSKSTNPLGDVTSSLFT